MPVLDRSGGFEGPPPADVSLRELLRVAMPMLLATGLAIAMSQCDVLMLRWLDGDAATGLYVVSIKISWVIALPLMSVNLLAAPAYAALWEIRSIVGMREKARMYSQFILWGTLPIALLLVIGGKTILGWHGAEYTTGYICLVILVIGQVVNAAVGSTALLLNMTGYQDLVAKVFAPCAIINVVANAILIPRYGATGAGVATTLSLSLWNLILIALIWKKLKLDTSWLNLLPVGRHRFDGELPDFREVAGQVTPGSHPVRHAIEIRLSGCASHSIPH